MAFVLIWDTSIPVSFFFLGVIGFLVGYSSNQSSKFEPVLGGYQKQQQTSGGYRGDS
jgi:hypothetical protein